MEKEIIKALGNLGIGAIGFWFLYIILKWLLGKFSTSLDKLAEKQDKHEEKSCREHKEIINLANHTSETQKEILEGFRRLNGKK